MDDEEQQFCNNCKRAISSSNFASHSAFCERKIFVCKICDEPVLISEKEEHVEEYHVISPCDLCESPIEKWMLPRHMEICPRRSIICEYCEADFPCNELGEHVEFCGSRTEKCLICKKYIMNKDKVKHSEFHKYEKEIHAKKIDEEIKQNEVNEVISKNNSSEKSVSDQISKEKYESYEGENIKRHYHKTRMEGTFHEAQASTPEKSISYDRRETQDPEIHTSEGAVADLSRKNREKYYGECHICKQSIPWIDMNTHVPSCASSAGKCSVCGENVPSSAIKNHMMEHIRSSQKSPQKVPQNHEPFAESSSFNNRFEKTQDSSKNMCPFCSHWLPNDEILEHSRYCSKTVYKCPLCYKTMQEKDKEKHLKFECRIIQENDANFSRSYQSFYECALCEEHVPEEDREQHTSFGCRSLLQSNNSYGLFSMRDDASDIYECPYCLKQMLAKEKGYHEGFKCPVLIEASGVDIPGPQSYSEVIKKTFPCNCKNSCEVCVNCNNRNSDHKIAEQRKKGHQEKRPCHKQMIDLPPETYLKNCSRQKTDKNNSKAPTSKTSYECKGAKPRNSSIKEIMQPRSGKCEHCQMTFTVDMLHFHEEQCVQLVECLECSKKMRMKDLEVHQCKTKKGKKLKSSQQASKDKDEPGVIRKFLNYMNPSSYKEDNESRNINRQYFDSSQQNSSSHYESFPTVEQKEALYFSGIGNEPIPCEFCAELFPGNDIVLHETGCKPDLVSYAKPDYSEAANQKKSTSFKKDSVSNDRSEDSHLEKDEKSPFFTRKHSLPSSVSSKFSSHTPKPDVEPGEFLNFYGKIQSRNDEDSELKGNQKIKKEKPLNIQSVWNTKDSITNDNYFMEISHRSDDEMDVDQPRNYSCTNEKNEICVEECTEVTAKADNDIAAMLMFLDSKNMRSDEECDAFSALRNEMKPKSSRTTDIVVDSNLLVSEAEGKHKKDFSHPIKENIDEESKVLFSETARSLNLDDENYSVKHDYSKLKRSLATSSGKIEYKTVLSDSNVEEPKKVYKENNSTQFSDKEKTISNYKKYFPDFKFASQENQSVARKSNKHHSEEYVMNEELERSQYQDNGVPRQVNSTKNHNEYLNDFKQLKDFRFDINKSKLAGEEIEHHISLHEKVEQQEISKHILSSNVEKESIRDFKFADQERKFFYGRDNMQSTAQPEKISNELEKLCKRQHDKTFDSNKDREYMNRVKGFGDFKFGFHNTTALADEKAHENVQHRKKNEESKKLSKQDTSHSDYSHYLPDFKYGAHKTKLSSKNNVLLDFTEKSDEQIEKSTFNLKSATSLLKEAGDAMYKNNREILDLDEKIAKFQMSLTGNVGDDAHAHGRKDFHTDALLENEEKRLKFLQDEFKAMKEEYENFTKNTEQVNQLYDIKRKNELEEEAANKKEEEELLEAKEKLNHLLKAQAKLEHRIKFQPQAKWRETRKDFASSDSD